MNDDKDLSKQTEISAPEAGESSPEASTPDSGARGEALPADLLGAYRKLTAEKKELYERLLRKQADLENFRKRLQREKEDFLQHATADLIRALLPVLDGFDRALRHRDASVPEHHYEGLQMIRRELMDVLRRAGLTEVETSGKTFDPHVHQAVEMVESPDYREQEIVEELQRGYKLKHRLLRPAIVKVAVHPSNRSSEAPAGGRVSGDRKA